MAISVKLENQIHERFEEIHDDRDESFIRACESGEPHSVRRGIGRYGDTMLNPYQLGLLVEELEALSPELKSEVVAGVIEAAKRVVRRRGYLYFIGD